MVKIKKTPPETIAQVQSRWLAVRNYAATKGIFDFEEDQQAYNAYVEGRRIDLDKITDRRAKKVGLKKPDFKFKKGTPGKGGILKHDKGTFVWASKLYHDEFAKWLVENPLTKRHNIKIKATKPSARKPATKAKVKKARRV